MILKKLAKKILKDEITELEEQRGKAIADYNRVNGLYVDLANKMAITEKANLAQRKELQNTIDDLQAQVKIMRQYYKLDEEPTFAEKMNMRIELRIHELELANLRLHSLILDNTRARDWHEVCRVGRPPDWVL